MRATWFLNHQAPALHFENGYLDSTGLQRKVSILEEQVSALASLCLCDLDEQASGQPVASVLLRLPV
jgi:hypothetical protein